MNCWRLAFEISDEWDDHEVQELLDTLESRGAHLSGFWVSKTCQLYIPQEFDYKPYYETLLDCRSVGWVDTQIHPVNYIPIEQG